VGHSELLRIALPLLANSLVAILLHQSTIWLLALFSTRDDVALFGAAARLAAATTVPLALANAVLPPLIAELNVLGKRADLEQMLRTVATFSVVLVAPLLLAFVFFGEQILSAVFGSYYASAWPALLLLAAGQFFNVATGSCGFTLTMTGHQTGYLVITILGGSATLALGLLLIPRFGSSGAAASAAMGLLLQYSAMVWLAHKRLGIWTHAGLPRPALLRRLISDLRKQVRGA
jgi:O-antigen/teichoic acid export membrane protein